MFGAYQAGVWRELEGAWRPDMIVGASAGCLNGWAIAGGVSGTQLVDMWLTDERSRHPRVVFPRSLRGGFLESAALEGWIRDLYSTYSPQCRIGVSLTEMWSFRLTLIEDRAIQWQHLAASCAVPGFLPQYRIDGRWYADGGLLAALPLWAALRMGADRIVTIDLLAPSRPWFQRWGGLALRRLRNVVDQAPPGVRVLDLSPPQPLAPLTGMIRWNRPRIEEWIARGRAIAAGKKQFLCDMF